MQVSETKLNTILYELYPVNVDYISNYLEYEKTQEYGRLKETIQNENLESNRQIHLLLQELKQLNIEHVSIEDYTMFLGEDRCYNIQLVEDLLDNNFFNSICINISVIYPFYTIYVLQTEVDRKTQKWLGLPARKKELELLEYSHIIMEVGKILEKKLNLIKFPDHLLFKKVKNITFQDIKLGDFNYFNGFFLNEFYTR